MPSLDYSEAPNGLFRAVRAQAKLGKVLTTTGAD